MNLKNIFHYLFKCSSFWELRPRFICPECKHKYRCYYDGNDCKCGKIHLCDGCYRVRHMNHDLTTTEAAND